MKKNIVKLVQFYVKFILFPSSRWYRSNLFLYFQKGKGLKDKPTTAWLIWGRLYMNFKKLEKKINDIYKETIIYNYSHLLKKHYLGNYAYDNNLLFQKDYQDEFMSSQGSMGQLFKNKFLLKIINIEAGDSFLDCGCGEGLNTKEIFMSFPEAKVVAFDISANAVDFLEKMLPGKNINVFQGSVTDMGVFKRYGDKSIDHVFFANILSTIFSGSISETRNLRKKIISESVRIARKNVILNEIVMSADDIRIEQKFRAHFYEDFSLYFNDFKNEGELFFTPRFIIFHKTNCSANIRKKDYEGSTSCI